MKQNTFTSMVTPKALVNQAVTGAATSVVAYVIGAALGAVAVKVINKCEKGSSTEDDKVD